MTYIRQTDFLPGESFSRAVSVSFCHTSTPHPHTRDYGSKYWFNVLLYRLAIGFKLMLRFFGSTVTSIPLDWSPSRAFLSNGAPGTVWKMRSLLAIKAHLWQDGRDLVRAAAAEVKSNREQALLNTFYFSTCDRWLLPWGPRKTTSASAESVREETAAGPTGRELRGCGL